MRREALQKSSALALHLTLWGAFLTLCVLILALPLQEQSQAFPQPADCVLLGLGMVTFGFLFFLRTGYQVTDSALEVVRPFGTLRILHRSIFRIDRIRRSSSGRENRVRVSFKQGGAVRTIELKPGDPADFLATLVPRCPQLSSRRQWKLARNESFRVAREVPPRKEAEPTW